MFVSAPSKAILWVTFNFFQTPSLSNSKHGRGDNAREVSLLCQYGHPLGVQPNGFNGLGDKAQVTRRRGKENKKMLVLMGAEQ